MSIFDTNTLLLLHCDDFNDTCDNYIVTNNSVTISSEGKFGNCFSINQSYITFNKSIELNCNTGFTIDFWINPSRFDNQYQYHLSSGLNFISYDKNKVYCSMCGINKDIFYVNEPLALNEFTHIAIVGENNVIKIFINGVLKASKDAINETQVFDTNNKFFIYQNGSTAHNPVCKIDEFRISNIARWQSDFEVPTKEYELVTIEKLNNESSLIDINDRNEVLVEGLHNLKTRLENNLNSIGVTDLDNNSILSLVNRVGNLTVGDLGGRKWASGVSISTSTVSNNHQSLNSTSGINNIYKLSVPKLDFTPKLIFASNYTNSSTVAHFSIYIFTDGIKKFIATNCGFTSQSGGGYIFKEYGDFASGENGTFMPTRVGSVQFDWIAFE